VSLRAHASPRFVGQPGGDLVLDSPASRAQARLIRRPSRAAHGGPRVHRSLESRRSSPVPLDLHRSLRSTFGQTARCLRKPRMPIPATDIDVSKVTTFLKGAGLNQLRCRRRADTLVIESGPAGDTTPHVRLRKLGANIWATDTATHTGRWEHM